MASRRLNSVLENTKGGKMIDLNYYRSVLYSDDPKFLKAEMEDLIDEVRQELEEFETAANDLLHAVQRNL